MTRLAKLQLIGPFVIFVAVLAAEAATYELAQHPSSETLWYINLSLFGVFQKSYYVLGSRLGIPGFQLFCIAFPMLVLACCGWIFGRRLMLAIASNLSFVYAGFLIYAWVLWQPRMFVASLADVPLPSGPGFYLLATLVGSSLLSFCISHFVYVRTFRTLR